MSNTRGGKRIRIVIITHNHPHSQSAKESNYNVEIPIVDTKYHRVTNTVEEFIKQTFDRKVFEELNLVHAIAKYRMDKMEHKFDRKKE